MKYHSDLGFVKLDNEQISNLLIASGVVFTIFVIVVIILNIIKMITIMFCGIIIFSIGGYFGYKLLNQYTIQKKINNSQNIIENNCKSCFNYIEKK